MTMGSSNHPVSRRLIIAASQTIDLAEIEAALSKSSLIEECVILSRDAAKGGVELVAYVVPALPYSADRLEAQVQSAMPPDLQCFCVPVSAIPLTGIGEVDEDALKQLPVVEKDLLRRWEKQLQAALGSDQAAVILQEKATEQLPAHLSDLILEWKPAARQGTDQGFAPQQTEEATAKDCEARPPAFADGGPLRIPADAPKTFTEAILRTAKHFPRKGIMHVRASGEEIFQSYPMLLEEAKCILAGLHAKGLKPGDRVILQCEMLSDHFSAFWACVLGGITPVNVAVAPSYNDRNAIVNKLYNVWKLLKHPTVIASAELGESISQLDRFFPGEKFNVLSVKELKSNPPTEDIHESKPDDLVFFQLTSGSTGVPKCIQESHRSIIAHIHGSAQFNGYVPDDVVLNWLPVDHVVPTLTCNLKDVYLGCEEIQVATNLVLAEPLRWLDLIEAHRVTHSWAPNFGFKLIADRLASVEGRKWDLSSTKFLMNAGEQVTLPVVSEFLRRTAPFGINPRMMQPSFGMAEACTCMTYTNDFSEQSAVHRFLKSTLSGLLQPSAAEDASTIAFVDLGPPVPGVQIRITDSQNQVVPEGKIGRFQIKGDVITRGYLYNDEANKDAFVGEGWFNSGDLGYIWKGRLALTGREKEMIIVRGANFYCYEIEDVVNALPGTQPTFTAAVAVSDPATGTEGLAIFFVPQKPEMEEKIRLIEEIRKTVASKLGINPSIIVALPKSEFCKTTSGKIQRNQMKKSLAAGQYDSLLKEVDLAQGNANTLPNWFYRRIWRRRAPGLQQRATLEGASVVFLDSLGLGERLCVELESGKLACVRVAAGGDFAKLDRYSYRMDPANANHYGRLLVSIAEDGIHPRRVFHLSAYRDFASPTDDADSSRSLNGGVLNLLSLAQALAAQPESQRVSRLVVASSHGQRVKDGDTVDPARSMVQGLLKTIPQEMPWLACSHVDLPGEEIAEEARLLLAEAQSPATEREVAWRGGSRWVPRLHQVDFQRTPNTPMPFRQGGLYVLTGGLGGIGVQIAKYLLDHHQVRLLILGRTPLPDRATGAHRAPNAEGLSEHLQAYQELERRGQVAYEAVDICDRAAVKAAATRAMTRWGAELDGVIHLAGLYQERLLNEETGDSFAAVLTPKVAGTLALHQLLKDRPGALFLSFASVNGFFGGFSVGAYSAANAFQESFAQSQRDAGLRSQCLAWSLWDETGMSRGFAMKQLARTRGYYSMHREQGIHSFLAAVQHDGGDMLIGLDGGKAAIRRYLDNQPCGLQGLSAYYVSRDSALAGRELDKLSVADRYHTATRCKLHRLDRMPVTAAGEIDRQQLAMRAQDGESDGEPPQTEIEKALAAVWTEVLDVDPVRRNDNFFDLGGHSLSAVQITFKIRQTFNIDFPLRTFLEAPVLRAQAQQLQEKLLSQADAAELERLMNEIEPTV